MRKTGIVAINLQNHFLLEENKLYNQPEFEKNVQLILDTARHNSYPVYLIQQAGKEGSGIEPGTEGWSISPLFLSELSETVIHSQYPDPFKDSDLDMVLKSDSIERVIICGIGTETSIDATCHSAFALQYDIVLSQDAHTTSDKPGIDAESTIMSLNQAVSDKLGTIMKTDDIVKKLEAKKFS